MTRGYQLDQAWPRDPRATGCRNVGRRPDADPGQRRSTWRRSPRVAPISKLQATGMPAGGRGCLALHGRRPLPVRAQDGARPSTARQASRRLTFVPAGCAAGVAGRARTDARATAGLRLLALTALRCLGSLPAAAGVAQHGRILRRVSAQRVLPELTRERAGRLILLRVEVGEQPHRVGPDRTSGQEALAPAD